jgi:hypothetical protein
MDESQTAWLRRDFPLCFDFDGDGIELPAVYARAESD